MGVTILVIKKNGRDLKREIWDSFIPRIPRVMPQLTGMPSEDPKTDETLELESIGSENSSERSIKITETHVKLETTHVPKCPEEVLNTGNAKLHGPNVQAMTEAAFFTIGRSRTIGYGKIRPLADY